jgi:tetratricopeptide (TPR) repeat protein
MAALEFGDMDLVDLCTKQLCKKFPGSIRVRRLLGLQYEYNGEYQLALDLYDNLLKENPSNLLVLKRKVCAYKSQGDLKAAVLEIHKILKIIYGDQGLWLELADIHMTMGDYQEAAFCMEELVLQDPHNAAFNSRLGKIF